MKIKIARGIGVNLALDTAGRIINRLYEHFKGIEEEDLAEKIRKYTVNEDGESTLEDKARRYNLEDKLAEYTSKVVYGLRRNLAYVKSITESASDDSEAFLYAKVQKAYNLLSKMLVYIPVMPPLAKKMNYISDIVKEYLQIGISHLHEKFLELTQNLDSERIRLVYAGARSTANWLNEEIKRQKGTPSTGLESVVNLLVPKTTKLAQITEGGLKLYHALFSTSKPIYGSDLSNPGYETIDYAVA